MKTVIPFTHGRGKTGQAKTGEERVLIKETEHYPHAFTHFKEAVSKLTKGWQSMYGTENVPDMQKELLKMLNKVESHVYECTMPYGEEVIFLNIDKFRTSELSRLLSVKVDGQEVYI